jgi:DNA mismatch repair protein MLH1
MFPVANHGGTLASSSSDSAKADPVTTPSNTLSKLREIKESECFLTSVKNLRKKVLKGKHRRGFGIHFNVNTNDTELFQS